MINAVHLILYSEDPAADRAFLRDVLGYSYVDTGNDWLIFKLPPGEAAVHPAEKGGDVEMYFMCDDLDATLAELQAHGAQADPVTQQRWGIVTSIRLPGGAKVGLYQPLHPVAYDL
jgi:predicted enzyme related to lactoylglutathione lyase